MHPFGLQFSLFPSGFHCLELGPSAEQCGDCSAHQEGQLLHRGQRGVVSKLGFNQEYQGNRWNFRKHWRDTFWNMVPECIAQGSCFFGMRGLGVEPCLRPRAFRNCYRMRRSEVSEIAFRVASVGFRGTQAWSVARVSKSRRAVSKANAAKGVVFKISCGRCGPQACEVLCRSLNRLPPRADKKCHNLGHQKK